MDGQRAALDRQRARLEKQPAKLAEMHGGGGPERWPMAPGFSRRTGSRALLLADQPLRDPARTSAPEDMAVMLLPCRIPSVRNH